ncbi:MAG: VWA domain-containing protein [Streptomycetaceae bacterium]|nr:VWA domain-containing protein [Streptomycetaceae bacterium]
MTTELAAADAARVVARFLDVAVGATGRATFYNTADEQAALERAAHRDLAALDRRLYAALIGVPDMLDRTRQTGVLQLLAEGEPADGETDAVRRAVAALTVPRMLNLYGRLATERVNNARARKLILRTLLGSPALELWAVRYRRKLAAALRHAWGERTAGIVRSVLTRELSGAELQPKERRILAASVDRWAGGRDRAVVHECVAFVLGAPGPFTLPGVRAYTAARGDLDAGRTLPYETLEGLRGRFHPGEPPARVLELTKGRLTAGQRIAGQAQAERAGVEVDVDFTRYDAVRLYVYAYERGLTDEVARALADRARRTAAALDLADRHVALVLDGSASMAGSGTQALRPIAVTLALRDALRAAAGECTEIWCGGTVGDDGLVRPSGATPLAEALLAALRAAPDLVVVVGDGYENAPAGRFDETLTAARLLGVRTPVVHMSPVLAAESGGVRVLSGEVPSLAVQRMDGLQLAACRLLLEADPAAAARMLAKLAGVPSVPALEAEPVELEEVST